MIEAVKEAKAEREPQRVPEGPAWKEGGGGEGHRPALARSDELVADADVDDGEDDSADDDDDEDDNADDDDDDDAGVISGMEGGRGENFSLACVDSSGDEAGRRGSSGGYAVCTLKDRPRGARRQW